MEKPTLDATGDPWLLTPGPLTTAPEVKGAMMRDLGSRDDAFVALSERVRERLLGIVDGGHSHVCVPLQGSGTFVVEAMLGTFVPADGEVLILVNGAYGRRMADICERMGRRWQVLEVAEDTPIDVVALDDVLTVAPHITHVAVVHCETTTGMLNPLEAVADVVASHCRGLLVDAMSAFGALPVDARTVPFDALVASSNKCLEGVPGVGFCLARRQALEAAAGNSPSGVRYRFDQCRDVAVGKGSSPVAPVGVLMGVRHMVVDEEAVESNLVIDLHCPVHVHIAGVDELLVELGDLA